MHTAQQAQLDIPTGHAWLGGLGLRNDRFGSVYAALTYCREDCHPVSDVK